MPSGLYARHWCAAPFHFPETEGAPPPPPPPTPSPPTPVIAIRSRFGAPPHPAPRVSAHAPHCTKSGTIARIPSVDNTPSNQERAYEKCKHRGVDCPTRQPKHALGCATLNPCAG